MYKCPDWEKTPIYQVFICGVAGIGKKTLGYRLYSGQFLNSKYIRGSDLFTKRTNTSDGRYVRLQIWYNIGGIRFRYMNFPLHLRGSCAGVVAFDSTCMSTYLQLPQYLEKIREILPTIPLFLVGTKCDLDESNQNKEEYLELVEKYNMKELIFTSSKTGHNVGYTFQRMVDCVVEPLVREPVIQRDAEVLTELETMVKKSIPFYSNLEYNYTFGTVVQNNQVVALRLKERGLNSLPDSIGNLTSLRELNLGSNRLTSLPDSIGNLTSLREVILSRNELTSLPECIGNLTSLRELILSRNELTSLPECIGNLTSLYRLNLIKNKLTSLPDSIGNLTSLKYLYLEHNLISSLPEIISKIEWLKSLDLSNNGLTSLPESIGNLTSLRELKLYSNKLISLPDSVCNLTSLRSLSLGDNKLVSLSNIPLKVLKSAHFSSDNLSSKGQLLVRSRNFKDIFHYYQKSPTILAQQYISDPKSLTLDEKERLSYEAGHLEKKILETKVNPDDPILVQITERLAVELPSGYKLHL